MDLDRAERLARYEMEKWRVESIPFKWFRGKASLGRVQWRRDRYTGEYTVLNLGLSVDYARHNREELVLDTIRHEIAHILAGVDQGHNFRWRAMCVLVGANPKRCKGPEDGIEGLDRPWVLRCSKCGKEFQRSFRRTRCWESRYHGRRGWTRQPPTVGCGGRYRWERVVDHERH